MRIDLAATCEARRREVGGVQGGSARAIGAEVPVAALAIPPEMKQATTDGHGSRGTVTTTTTTTGREGIMLARRLGVMALGTGLLAGGGLWLHQRAEAKD